MKTFLGAKGAPRVAIVLGLIVSLLTLGNGIVADDLWVWSAFHHSSDLHVFDRHWWNIFSFFDDPADIRHLREIGIAPWWVDEQAHAVFFRPLTGFTHLVDYTLWPNAPVLMHAQSVLWYGALCAVAVALYRRILRGSSALVIGTACLVYALDGNHGVPVGWLANRNALISAVGALGAILLHDVGARRDGVGWSFLAALALAAGLGGGEGATAGVAFLVAHAAFLDERPRKRRLLALAPHGLVLAAYVVVYRLGDFGARRSGVYVEPLRDPLEYAKSVVVHLPILLASELGLSPPDLFAFMKLPVQIAIFGIALALVVFAALGTLRLVRQDARARFFAVGALLAVLPTCATFPAGRLMTMASFGTCGLLALVLARLFDGASLSRLERAFARWTFAMRIVLAPATMCLSLLSMRQFSDVTERMGRLLPDQEGGLPERVVIVNSPEPIFFVFAYGGRVIKSEPRISYKLLTLAGGARRVTFAREDDHTVVVDVENGLYRGGLETLVRRADLPMPPGTEVRLSDAHVLVREAAPDGVPTKFAVRFDEPLDSPKLAWVVWDGAGLVRRQPPPIGEPLVIEGHGLMFQ